MQDFFYIYGENAQKGYKGLKGQKAVQLPWRATALREEELVFTFNRTLCVWTCSRSA